MFYSLPFGFRGLAKGQGYAKCRQIFTFSSSLHRNTRALLWNDDGFSVLLPVRMPLSKKEVLKDFDRLEALRKKSMENLYVKFGLDSVVSRQPEKVRERYIACQNTRSTVSEIQNRNKRYFSCYGAILMSIILRVYAFVRMLSHSWL